jgi:hypothetical protein
VTTPAAFYLQPLSWHQLARRPETYELRALPGPIGSLIFESRRTAVAQTDHAAWRFAPRGVFRRSVEVSLLPHGKLLAVCQFHFWGPTGTLAIPGVPVLRLAPATWDRGYTVKTQAGRLVLSYDFRGWVALRSPLTWGVEPGPAEQLGWLIYLSWYLAVRHYREVIETAAAVIVSG